VKERRYAEGLCQQCGSPDISPRSATGVRCTPCLDRSIELKKARRQRLGKIAYSSARERAWRDAGLCIKCGAPPCQESTVYCAAHREMANRAHHSETSWPTWGVLPTLEHEIDRIDPNGDYTPVEQQAHESLPDDRRGEAHDRAVGSPRRHLQHYDSRTTEEGRLARASDQEGRSEVNTSSNSRKARTR